MSDSFSLVTLNTWKCDGDYPRRLQLMRQGFAELAPDIACLQEVFVEEEQQLSTLASLASAVPADSRFEPARYRERPFAGGSAPSWSGMGLLSRRPILAYQRLELPTHPRDGQRVAQLAVIGIGDERVLVVNAHLTYLRREEELRCAQVANILRHPLLEDDYAAMFLCGDLNDPPEGALMEWLRQRRGWRVVDCYEAAGGRGPRHSTLADDVARADSPLGPNFDYVLLLERLGPSRVEIEAADYCFNRPDPETGLYPSDHFGIHVRLRLNGAGA